MDKIKKLLITLILLSVISLPTIYYFGRPLWRPVYFKIVGKKTVSDIISSLDKKGLSEKFTDLNNSAKLILCAIKDKKTLEIWTFMKNGDKRKLCEYPFTNFSGKLGPKLKQGDRQIPEGIYKLDYLNPNSSFHLSMKVNYPNEFDRMMAKFDQREKLGYDIFIHGGTATIGCIPIGDDKIEELFYIVAKVGIENVEVIISPYDMRNDFKKVEIGEITWEDKLYSKIRKRLSALSLN